MTFLSLKTPSYDQYNFYLLYTDKSDHFKFDLLSEPIYHVKSPHTKLGFLPKYIPNCMEKVLLYWQFLPKF